jgi:hypothetical protein
LGAFELGVEIAKILKNLNFKVLIRVACEKANSMGIISDVQQDAAVQNCSLLRGYWKINIA